MRFLPLLIHVAIMMALTLAVVMLPPGAFADQLVKEASEAGQSGTPRDRIPQAPDGRVDRLEAYLAFHNSPLTPYASVFVEKADFYKLDWRLVTSISGVESTFGKFLPAGSYNAYGWNGGNFYFKSWEDGVDTVSRTLRVKYMDKWNAKTVAQIARIYAPPSQTWAYNVNFFMEQIEKGPKTKDATLELKLTI